jgi:hypothetical protein
MCADSPAVIVGQRPVTPRLFLVLDHVLRAKEVTVVAQVLVEFLRRVGQDGCQDRLQIVHDAQDDLHRRRRCGPGLLDLEPGRLAVQACTACPEGTEGSVANV